MSGHARSDTTRSFRAPGTLRILLVSNMWPSAYDPVYGVFVERHVKALRAQGATVTVVANRDSRNGSVRSVLKYAGLLSRAIAATVSGRYDVVVGHYLYSTSLIAITVSRILSVPCVLVAHGTDVRSVQHDSSIARASRRAIARTDLIVAVSHALAARLQEAVDVGAATRVAVVNMGVDTRVFRPDPASRAALGLAAADRIVLFAGKLVPVKGLDVLLDAFALLRDEGGADRLVVLGEGPLHGTLRTRARTLGIADHVTFLGQLTQAEVARWMSAADVFALPSRDEGLGLVLLEAMACGTPCVGTAVGGIPEVLSGTCGRVVEPERADMLARSIAELIGIGKANLSEECVRRASTCDVDGQAASFIREVESLLHEPRGLR